MVDLDKIKSAIKDLCADMEQAYSNLDNRRTSCEEEDKKVEKIKAEILLLDVRKANVSQSLKDEEFAASDKKKEHTEKKIKYKKLIEEEEATLDEHRARVVAETDTIRIREMSQLKAEKGKVTTEITLGKQELAEIRTEYRETRTLLAKLKEGITV